MARKRKYKRRKKKALDYVALPKIDLDPDIKRGIFMIVILIFGVFCALALFGGGGAFGDYLQLGQALAFGWGKWFFPVILLTLVFFLYNADKYYVRGINYLGMFLFIISFQSILHYFIPLAEWKEMAAEGIGGGFMGYYLATGFHQVLGFWGSILVLVGILVISLMLMFETTLSALIGAESMFAKMFYPVKVLFARLFSRKERDDDDDDEVEEEFEEEEEEIEEEPEEEEELEEEGQFSKTAVSDQPEFMEEETEKPKKDDGKVFKPSNVEINIPLNLLSGKAGKPSSGDVKNNQLTIQKTLENFNIPVEMGDVSVGPTVTQYTFKPSKGIKLSRITTLNNDLALALAAHPIRIEAPIPGKALVGIEVPNQTKAMVRLKEVLDDKEFKTRKNNLQLALGKDVSGKVWQYDLTKMPHLLVAGATNSGKSVCLNGIIVSLLYQNNPDDLKFIMVDPKRVELPVYNNIPHLLTPVITDVNKTINALKWCLNEMDRRFELLSKARRRDIATYNETAKEKMPYLVFIIDELADLMVVAAKDIEVSIIRLAQMARAVGIHLILATQRPSVDVITGLIKANMPARIAFSVASGIDSKTILDSLGAEKLLGQGDMLFMTAEISKPKRIQGAYLSDKEIRRITNYIKEHGGEAEYIEGVTERQKVSGIGGVGLDGDSENDDELYEEAKEIVINMGKASASLLQRRLSIGYARAARLMDILEERGIVGGANGSKPREILVSKEQYEALTEQGVSGVSIHDRDEAEAPDEYLDGGEEDDDESSAKDSEDKDDESPIEEKEDEGLNNNEGSDEESKEENIETEDELSEEEDEDDDDDEDNMDKLFSR